MKLTHQQAAEVTNILAEAEQKLMQCLGQTATVQMITPGISFHPKAEQAESIKSTVASAFDIHVNDLDSYKRKQPLPEAKFMCWQLMREKGYTYKDIMQQFKCITHHSTIIHGLQRFNALYDTEQQFRERYHQVKTIIFPNI